MKTFILSISLLLSVSLSFSQNIYKAVQGEIAFFSETPIENIDAHNTNLKALLNTDNNEIAFVVTNVGFKFEKPLMEEHFNENYMETTQFPKAKFTGKIIEQVNFEQVGTQSIRAKGILSIHGVDQERIVKSTLSNHNGKLYIQSKFTVPVADHNISIPRIVHQKIAEEIEVTVTAVLSPQ